MRIALFRTEIEAYGGSARLISEYVKRSKHTIGVYGIKVATHGMIKQILNKSNVYLIHRWGESPQKIAFRFKALKKIIEENRYDAVMIFVGPIFSELPLIHNYRIPLMVYTQGVFRFLDNLRYNLKCPNIVCNIMAYGYGLYLSILLSKCSLIATHSYFTKKLMTKYMPRLTKHIYVIHPGIDTSRYSFSLKHENYFLTVSRIDPLKRIDLIVEAFKLLVNRYGDKMKLIIAGNIDNKNLPYLKKLITMSRGYPIEFVLNPNEDELLDLYRRAYAFIFASDNEPFGITPLEAMSCGKPVIAAVNDGGALDYLRDGVNGIHVLPNALELAEAMYKLAEDEELSKNLSINARKTALKYDIELFVRHLDTLLEKVYVVA